VFSKLFFVEHYINNKRHDRGPYFNLKASKIFYGPQTRLFSIAIQWKRPTSQRCALIFLNNYYRVSEKWIGGELPSPRLGVVGVVLGLVSRRMVLSAGLGVGMVLGLVSRRIIILPSPRLGVVGVVVGLVSRRMILSAGL